MQEFLDQQIAQQLGLKPICSIAERVGLTDSELVPYGRYMAKMNRPLNSKHIDQSNLILVTSINPTAAGEGKTVTAIGLNDALCRIGQNSMLCLRQPSMGPYFGMKGGATGGGYAQVGPGNEINTHFTGDFHAITSAHNLLACVIDNIIYRDNELELDPKKIYWPRVLDVNDRSLRDVVTGLGVKTDGVTRQSSFDITAASEIMAIVALAESKEDLVARLSRIVIGYSTSKSKFVYAHETGCINAIANLLNNALKPNLIQSLEHNPVLMHAGPFANIAHGCSSVLATKTALSLADYVVTEAGFGSDLGAEKFFDIKCRQAGLNPSACVCVVTVKALKMHGGANKSELIEPNQAALELGLANLGVHLDNLSYYGVPTIVAINHITGDTEDEIDIIQHYCQQRQIAAIVSSHYSQGSSGAISLAKTLISTVNQHPRSKLHLLYPDDMPLIDKIHTVAKKIYLASDVKLAPKAIAQIKEIEASGWQSLPVCMAKTQYSLSADPKAYGVPSGHILHIREVKLSSGAGFIVALCGEIIRMPGMPKIPAAINMPLQDSTFI